MVRADLLCAGFPRYARKTRTQTIGKHMLPQAKLWH